MQSNEFLKFGLQPRFQVTTDCDLPSMKGYDLCDTRKNIFYPRVSPTVMAIAMAVAMLNGKKKAIEWERSNE